jgi:hypothetical protein
MLIANFEPNFQNRPKRNDACFSIHDEGLNCYASAFLRESGAKISSAFELFSDSAQRIGVYTASDYVEIMQKLSKWEIDKISGLTDEAEKHVII